MFKAEYQKKTLADVRDLARKLLDNGSRTPNDDEAIKFVLFREARDLAVKAGDVGVAIIAPDEMVKLFAIDAIGMKLATLSKLAQAAKTPDALVTVSQALFTLGEQAVAADRYDDALKALEAAEANAKTAKDMALMVRCQAMRKDVAEIKKGFQKLKADDPDQTPSGFFLCAVKGDWQKGLPLLAQGTDPRLKEAAEKDLSNPSDPAKQAEVADAWWEYGTTERNALVRQRIQGRAVHWYRQCWKRLTGVARTRGEERVKVFEIQLFGDEIEIVPGVPSRTKGLALPFKDVNADFEIMTHMGRPCLKTTGPLVAGSPIYVDVSDTWASVASTIEIAVDYFDGPTGTISVEHHTFDGSGKFLALAATSEIRKLVNTGTWKTLVCTKISSTCFRNTATANIGVDTDFRVMCRDDNVYISRVSIRRVK